MEHVGNGHCWPLERGALGGVAQKLSGTDLVGP